MRNIILFLLIMISTYNCKSQTELQIRNVATGLDTPWEILWGPDNFIWMTERYGRISRVNPSTGDVTELIRMSEVFEDGERGLMGMVLHPDFQNNPYLYTIYNYRGYNGETLIKLIRLTYDGSILKDPLTLIDSIKGAWNHDGSRLFIDNDMTMYMTMGDAAEGKNAQDMNVLNGKVLRLNLDGTIPSDNPFPGSYIWSFGHRNQQGLIKVNGILYSSEHGPDRDDEVNIIEKGRNYGWPTVNGKCDTPQEKQFCDENNVIEPIAAWTPTLAVAGIDFYNKNLIPEWNNSILMVVLKSSRLVQMKLSDDGKQVIDEKHYFTNQYGRLRDICISPDGRVFITTSNKDGRGSPGSNDDRIIEIKPLNTNTNDSEKKNEISISPNPFSGNVEININDLSVHSKINIVNSTGIVVKELASVSNNIMWDGSDYNGFQLPAGLYFIKIQNNNKVSLKKVIKF